MPESADPFRPPFDADDEFVAGVRRAVAHRRRRRRFRRASVLAAVTVVAVLGVSWITDSVERVRTVELGRPADDVPSAGALGDEPFDVLVLGTDGCEVPHDESLGPCEGRAIGPVNYDSMVVARIDPVDATVGLLSIPRDLWIPSGARDTGGATRVSGAADPATLRRWLADDLGIDVRYGVAVSWTGFRSVVRTLDVRIESDQDVRDDASGLVLQRGCQRVDDAQLLALARARHLVYDAGDGWVTDPTGDLGRVVRQQRLLGVLAAVVADQSSVLDLPRLLTAAGDGIAFDTATTIEEMTALGRLLGRLRVTETAVVPTAPATDHEQGPSVQVLVRGTELDSALDVVGGAPVGDEDAAGAASPTPASPPTATDLAWQEFRAC